jgi:hypothetical protein
MLKITLTNETLTDLLQKVQETRRLMQVTGMSLRDCLSLLIDRLRYIEEMDQQYRELQHLDHPGWVYEQPECCPGASRQTASSQATSCHHAQNGT